MASSNQNLTDHRKLALIIANGNYRLPENRLSNSTRNATELSNLLETINFNVTIACDLNKHDMTTAIVNFSKTVVDGDLILFYFSGHGYQVDAENYLIPVGDARIRADTDVLDFAIDIKSKLLRLKRRNPSYVTILILDCCRPYVLYNASRSNSTVDGSGLHEMEASAGTFIQFACAANQTVNNDLFTKHLLKNIAQENMDITDIFRRIVDGVYQESNGRQHPLSINGLPSHEHIYLNQVFIPPEEPPECPLDEINQDEIECMLKKQAQLRDYYGNFPNIEDVVHPNSENFQKAKELTDSMMSKVWSVTMTERDTACHVLYKLFDEKNCQCIFFDSSQNMNLYDASPNLHELRIKDRPFILKLHTSDGLGNQKYKEDQQYDLRLIKTLNRVIEQKESSSITEDILERLSKAHNIDTKNIHLKRVYGETFNIVYTVNDSTENLIEILPDISEKLMTQFEQFEAAKIHPLLYRPSFDIKHFDLRGNKIFSDPADKFQIGPPRRTQTYIQPVNWTRYGLNVLGRYTNDKWLHPFQDSENWYRAYHGTGRAKSCDFTKPVSSYDQNYAFVDAAASIYENGFLPARIAVYGSGVYCSPKPTFPETEYVGEVELDTESGKKTFKLMLQVAVNPDGVKIATKDIWVVERPENIRTYGILIKEA